MSPIILEVAALGDIVGVRIVNKVFDFLAILLFVLGFVFILDLGLDIEEGCAVVLATFATVLLPFCQSLLHYGHTARRQYI